MFILLFVERGTFHSLNFLTSNKLCQDIGWKPKWTIFDFCNHKHTSALMLVQGDSMLHNLGFDMFATISTKELESSIKHNFSDLGK